MYNHSKTCVTRPAPIGFASGTAGSAVVPGSVLIRGNSALAGRSGTFFSDEVVVSNTAAPFKGDLTLLTALPGSPDQVNFKTVPAILPKAFQVFTYDADGNMTCDGMWNYQYDSENRLIRMETTAEARRGRS